MFDLNILYGLLIVVGLALFFVFVRPKDFNYYQQIKLALLFGGLAYRNDKVKKICEILLDIVNEVEKLEVIPEEKCATAIQMASVEIFEKLGIDMNEDLLESLVNVAVSYIPATHK